MKRVSIILATALAWGAGALALLPDEGDLTSAQTALTVASFAAVSAINLCVACRRR